jgi:hypothetical protein
MQNNNLGNIDILKELEGLEEVKTIDIENIEENIE